MTNLSIEITHSLSFLTNTIHDLKKLYTSTQSIISELNSMDLDKDGNPGQIRKKSADHRKDSDEIIEFILDDYKLFQKNMNNINKDKHNENVIYSLRRYRELCATYKDTKKDFDKFYNKIEIIKDKCVQDKDYVRFIALNKVSIPVYKINQILDSIISCLEILTNEKKEA